MTDEHPLLLIDAHVHYHDRFAFPAFLDAALENFRRAVGQIDSQSGWTGCLLLADPLGRSSVGRIREQICDRRGNASLPDQPWRLQPTGEAASWTACRGDGERILLVMGRQVVTQERIELLALGCADLAADHCPLAEAVELACRAGAIVVLPWGFGKWWFGRGRRLGQWLPLLAATQGSAAGEVFLGDNAGRPQGAWEPPLFRRARALGLRILPGSDPLPLAWHTHLAGSYGFVLRGSIDPRRPMQAIRRLLGEHAGQPPSFGRRAGWIGWARNQWSLLRLGRRA